MTDVAVVHVDLTSKGGGESVAMTAIEALQADYDVTLLTFTDPDLQALNDYFNTDVDVDALDVERAGRVGPAINARFGTRYHLLQAALLARYARRRAADFDLVVSTINELGLPAPAIEYVHYPFDWLANMDDRDEVFHPPVEAGSPYQRICSRLADVRPEDVRGNGKVVFANSAWTADRFADAYGVRPEVLYPPIDTAEFEEVPWGDREDGFVTVGRVDPSKRIVRTIRIVDRLRGRGHDVHLHVVGPAYDEDYFEEIRRMGSTRDYVEVEGEVSRPRLVDLLSTHRYGIHGKEHEHFGMAVAEILAGGAIPFVPSSGGQHAIVHEDPRLSYDSAEDAVEKIDAVLSDGGVQRRLRRGPREIERKFGRKRFEARFREMAAAVLDRPSPDVRVPSRVPGETSNDD